jgi:hypothetical protein
MADLGNKMNPFLAGLTGLGEGFFNGYLTRLKMNQDQQQIDFQQRRMSLLDLMNQNNINIDNARQDKLATAQIDNYNSEIKAREKLKATDEWETVSTDVVGSGTFANKPVNVLRNKRTGEIKQEERFQKPDPFVGLNTVLKNLAVDKAQTEKTDKENTQQNQTLSRQSAYDSYMASTYDPNRGAYITTDGKSFKNSTALRNYALLKTANMPGDLNRWERDAKGNVTDHTNKQSQTKSSQKTKIMSRSDFIKDFQKDQGRLPNEGELRYAQSKGIFK